MSVSEQAKVPPLRTHKATGSGYVVLNGKRNYLGKRDDPACQPKYDRLIAEWLAAGRYGPATSTLTVVELAARYWEHAREYYRAPDGQEAKSLIRVKLAIRDLRNLYGNISVNEFGALQLQALRGKWIDRNLCRTTINDRVTVVRAIFRWGAAQELVDERIPMKLANVENLQKGRSRAKESRKVLPVPDADVENTLAHLPGPVVALIRLQLLTGARPGELINLRPCDIDRTGAVWTVTLEHHKTSHKGHERVLYMGPQAQCVLRPLLLRDTDRPLFSPKDAEAERHEKSRKSKDGGRRLDQKPNKKKTNRVVRDTYDRRTYNRAIERACEKAGVTRWHPNQLRHNCATALRKTLGIEAAQIMLGHARVDTTEIYAERNQEAARKIAADHG